MSYTRVNPSSSRALTVACEHPLMPARTRFHQAWARRYWFERRPRNPQASPQARPASAVQDQWFHQDQS